MPDLTRGLYVLSDEVKSPKPDRRTSRDFERATAWPKGLRVYYKPARDGMVAELRCNEWCYRGTINCHTDNKKVWETLMSKMVPAPDTLGNLFAERKGASSDVDAEYILAMLVEGGKLTVADVRAAADRYYEMDEENSDPILKKHDIGLQ